MNLRQIVALLLILHSMLNSVAAQAGRNLSHCIIDALGRGALRSKENISTRQLEDHVVKVKGRGITVYRKIMGMKIPIQYERNIENIRFFDMVSIKDEPNQGNQRYHLFFKGGQREIQISLRTKSGISGVETLKHGDAPLIAMKSVSTLLEMPMGQMKLNYLAAVWGNRLSLYDFTFLDAKAYPDNSRLKWEFELPTNIKIKSMKVEPILEHPGHDLYTRDLKISIDANDGEHVYRFSVDHNKIEPVIEHEARSNNGQRQAATPNIAQFYSVEDYRGDVPVNFQTVNLSKFPGKVQVDMRRGLARIEVQNPKEVNKIFHFNIDSWAMRLYGKSLRDALSTNDFQDDLFSSIIYMPMADGQKFVVIHSPIEQLSVVIDINQFQIKPFANWDPK